ncbi:MAG: tetratricopeptide repeat protein [Alphaproteobacteria bacterium]|nr:tetratricopeptide repeat protein [Alphaproteobacteria bacterium]
MADGVAALAAAFGLCLFLIIRPATAEHPCGTAESRASCLAPCADNEAMRARRVALTRRAGASEPDALFEMGQSWLGVPGPAGGAVCTPDLADFRAAASWFQRAADRGHVGAQVALGDYYELGQGGEQDYARAFRWFHRAAAQGHPRAVFRIGVFHDFGRSTAPKDAAVAALWYARAAALGSCDARFALATMYAQGRGVASDAARAFALYDLVVEEGNAVCYGRSSGDAGRARKSIAAQMSEAERTAARAGVAAWLTPR